MAQKQKMATPAAVSYLKNKWVWLALILTITFVSFYPSLKCQFTNWDDNVYIEENNLIKSLSLKNIKNIFSPSNPVSLNYHPLTILSLAIDYHYSKLDAVLYHKTNLLLHLMNVLLVFFFIYQLSGNLPDSLLRRETNNAGKLEVAVIVALLFGIHPMRVESVTWIAERKDVLYTFFFLSALLSYLKYTQTGKWTHYALTLVLFICSVLSKAVAVVLPVVLLLIDLYQGRKINLKSLLPKLPFFAFSLILGFIAYSIQSKESIAAFNTFTIFQRIMFACYGFIMYIVKLFLPVNLSAYYPYPFTDASGNVPVYFMIMPFIVLIIASGVAWSLKKTKIIAFGFAFYFITAALVLQFISVGQVIMADRYSYVPYLGLFFIIGEGYRYVKSKNDRRWKLWNKVFFAVLAGSAALFSYLTYERTKVWQNSETLWTDVISKYPYVETAYENRGNYYAHLNKLDDALKDYETLLKMKTKNQKIYSNLGNIYGLRKEFDKSLNAYSQAIAMQADNPEAHLNRAITYSMMRKYPEAFADYEIAMKKLPDNIIALKNRSYTYLASGEFEKSLIDYDKLLSLYPADTLSYLNRGIVKFNMQKYRDAISDFKTFIAMKPNNPEAHYNLSVCYSKSGNYKAAYTAAVKASQLGQNVSPDYMKDLKDKAR